MVSKNNLQATPNPYLSWTMMKLADRSWKERKRTDLSMSLSLESMQMNIGKRRRIRESSLDWIKHIKYKISVQNISRERERYGFKYQDNEDKCCILKLFVQFQNLFSLDFTISAVLELHPLFLRLLLTDLLVYFGLSE